MGCHAFLLCIFINDNRLTLLKLIMLKIMPGVEELKERRYCGGLGMKSNQHDNHEKRKSEHIDIVLNQQVAGVGITTGFEKYRFIHQALPDLDFASIIIETTFLNKKLMAPFLVSSMTGGTQLAAKINRHLAITAEQHGWAMGVGSTRAAIESPDLSNTFHVRKFAPTIPILTNLGAVQLNYGYGIEECRRAVDLVEADGLILHLNSMQEVFQPNGNTNFEGLLKKIERLCKKFTVPIGVKEVGWGIDGSTARRLFDVGVSFVDVAGAGGTSWSQVEKHRTKDDVLKDVAEAFNDWGIPTSDCLLDVRKENKTETVIASGGMKTGVDAAKALALGANLVGFGRTLLEDALDSTEALSLRFDRVERELRTVMFGIGEETIIQLKNTPHIKLK